MAISRKGVLQFVAGFILAIIVGRFVFVNFIGPKYASVTVAKDVSADAVFASSFVDLDDKMQPLKQWRGKVIVLNFWAPWCPPCREEIPDFIKLQNKYRDRGLVFVGIALDEKLKVQAFADEVGVNYPILLGEIEAVDLAKNIGNRLGGLPFTAIIDRNGKVSQSEVGGLTMERLEKIVLPLL